MSKLSVLSSSNHKLKLKDNFLNLKLELKRCLLLKKPVSRSPGFGNLLLHALNLLPSLKTAREPCPDYYSPSKRLGECLHSGASELVQGRHLRRGA